MRKKVGLALFAASAIVSLNAFAGWSSQQLVQSVAPMATDIGPVCQVVTTTGLRYAAKMDTVGQSMCETAKAAMLQSKYVNFMNPNWPSNQEWCDKLTYKPVGESSQTACIAYSIAIQR